jgi:ABC-2 type transport system ATP-binding protein
MSADLPSSTDRSPNDEAIGHEPLAVATFGLTKRYRSDVLAVDRVDLRVARGEIYGFLGPNGAGKSTTIRMLLGMIAPTAGHAELFGERVRADAPTVWRRVGHLVESATAYPELTVRENLEVARRLQGVGDRASIARRIDQLNLGEYADRRAGTLSLGNLQRLALARALLHEPELLILDEPANGLDPAGVIEVRELLRELAQRRGATVLISSHILGEVDRLATRIGIIHRGRLIEELDNEALERHRDVRLEIDARDPATAEAALRQAGFIPDRRDGEGPYLELREPRAIATPDEIARILVEAGSPPTHLALTRETLEDHFMRLTAQTDVATEPSAPSKRAEVAA